MNNDFNTILCETLWPKDCFLSPSKGKLRQGNIKKILNNESFLGKNQEQTIYVKCGSYNTKYESEMRSNFSVKIKFKLNLIIISHKHVY